MILSFPKDPLTPLQNLLKDSKVVFTNGCFDILHAGHVRYLAQAKELGEVLVVGLNTDSSMQALKGPTRPINPEEDRAEILHALKAVDHVILFGEETPKNLIETLLPDVLCKGGDYTVETVVGHQTVLANGGEVRILPFLEGRSTTRTIQKIQEE